MMFPKPTPTYIQRGKHPKQVGPLEVFTVLFIPSLVLAGLGMLLLIIGLFSGNV